MRNALTVYQNVERNMPNLLMIILPQTIRVKEMLWITHLTPLVSLLPFFEKDESNQLNGINKISQMYK